MTKIEEKTLKLYDDFVRTYKVLPTIVHLVVKYKNDKKTMETYASLNEFDIDTKDDDSIFFYFGGLQPLMLATSDNNSNDFEFQVVDIYNFLG